MPIIQNNPNIVTGYLNANGQIDKMQTKLNTIENGAEKNKIESIEVNGILVATDNNKTVNLQNIAKTNQDVSFNSNVSISGDLNVAGKTTSADTENIKTKEDTITLREANPTSLANNALAGIIAHNYNGIKDGLLGFDNSGTARVGDIGEEQPLLTRSEESDINNNDILIWQSNTHKAIGKQLNVSDILQTSVVGTTLYFYAKGQSPVTPSVVTGTDLKIGNGTVSGNDLSTQGTVNGDNLTLS